MLLGFFLIYSLLKIYLLYDWYRCYNKWCTFFSQSGQKIVETQR